MANISPEHKRILGVEELQKILPQVYPFLLIDRVEDYKEEEYLIASKNITGSEWCQEGTSSKTLYFPETLIIEAAAQAALVLYHVSRVKPGQKKPQYFLGKIKSEFSNAAQVGSTLKILAFATKLMDVGGYSNIEVSAGVDKISHVEVTYSVKR